MESLSGNTGILKDRIINEHIPLIQAERGLLIGLPTVISQRNTKHAVCVETQNNVIKLITPWCAICPINIQSAFTFPRRHNQKTRLDKFLSLPEPWWFSSVKQGWSYLPFMVVLRFKWENAHMYPEALVNGGCSEISSSLFLSFWTFLGHWLLPKIRI